MPQPPRNRSETSGQASSPPPTVSKFRLPRSFWYRLAYSLCLLAPAIATLDTAVSPIDGVTWERIGEAVYANLLRWQGPDTAASSRVVLVEVDQKTIDTFGWPLDRSYYVQALAKLQEAGHPWILSLLQFQALGRAVAPPDVKMARQADDAKLADAIRTYGRYIGTGLRIQAGSELDAAQEDQLMPRVTLARQLAAPTASGAASTWAKVDLPRLPLTFAEDDRFVEAQKAFGFGTHFGTEAVVRCMQMYLTDAGQQGAFLIPSAMVWSAVHALNTGLTTAVGASWPRPGEAGPAATSTPLQVAYKTCLTSPGVTTRQYLTARGIRRLSMVDLLGNQGNQAFNDKVVILARSDMRRFRGPGFVGSSAGEGQDDGIVEEQLLAARFLDGLLSGSYISRQPAPTIHNFSRDGWLIWLPLVCALTLAALALAVSLHTLIALTGVFLLALLSASAWELSQGIYLVPTQAFASLLGTAIGLTCLWIGINYYSIRRQVRFAAALRTSLSSCNTLPEVEAVIQRCCGAEFGRCDLQFGDFDRELFEAAGDAQHVLNLLDKRRQVDSAPKPALSVPPMTLAAATHLSLRPKWPWLAHKERIALPVSSRLGRLGTVNMQLRCETFEILTINKLLDILTVELSQHWHRIQLAVEQKLLDYRYLREQARGEIMARFLTKVLVQRFSDARSMEENLRLVLTPRPTRAALMQADIRGYSKISATMAPEEMVRLLQSYYREVVDAAQHVAQVKLIGDCIFLFIEEGVAAETSGGTASAADLALELAAFLARETEQQNARRQAAGGEPLNFGVAIHFGDVVVGNLSSDSCIDYTVIGPNVNMVARLEETTKNAAIASRIGTNGMIISDAAAKAFKRHAQVPLLALNLTEYNVAVRSFADVTMVRGLSAAAAKNIVLPPRTLAA